MSIMTDTERWMQGILRIQSDILDHNVALLKNQTGIMEDLKALNYRVERIEKTLGIKNEVTTESSGCPITMNMEQLKKRLLELKIENPSITSQGDSAASSSSKWESVSSPNTVPKRKSMTPAQDRLKMPRS